MLATLLAMAMLLATLPESSTLPPLSPTPTLPSPLSTAESMEPPTTPLSPTPTSVSARRYSFNIVNIYS